MLQQINVIGNLGNDPELRYTQEGKAILTFSVANQQTYKGQKQTTWFHVSVFDKLAENLSKFAQKGTKVYVSGKLNSDPATGSPRIYQKKDGSAGATFEIIAATVECLANFKSDDPYQKQQQPKAQPQQQPQQQTQYPEQPYQFDETEIPW